MTSHREEDKQCKFPVSHQAPSHASITFRYTPLCMRTKDGHYDSSLILDYNDQDIFIPASYPFGGKYNRWNIQPVEHTPKPLLPCRTACQHSGGSSR
jgi:hypothetical protein